MAEPGFKEGDKAVVRWMGDTITVTLDERQQSGTRVFWRVLIDGTEFRPAYEENEIRPVAGTDG